MDDRTDRQEAAKARLWDALQRLDEQTRLPGEERLLITVARQAREAREASSDTGPSPS